MNLGERPARSEMHSLHKAKGGRQASAEGRKDPSVPDLFDEKTGLLS